MNNTRRSDALWKKLAKQDAKIKRDCPFCSLAPHEVIETHTPTMLVLHNRVKYDTFEGIPVRDHFMLVPRQHRTKISEFTKREKDEYLELIEHYEDMGYSFYGRGLANAERSQKHLHTHILKLEGRRVKLLIYLRRPYLVWYGRQAKKRA